MPLVHRIRDEKIAELRELAARTLAETHEAGWPYSGCGPRVWSDVIECLLGGPAGAYCGAVHPYLLITLLNELGRLRKEVARGA
ncbi:hypothetical protein [Nocardia brasiliensis]|uniref:hypothetical protein n=1 Tax=Nocardia brasiliensis TaxID=37326 RepID=UPI002457A0F3|nr:hypothetical protein [Nocardia brasiliensis]